MIAAFVLSRSNDQQIFGIVQSSVSLGLLAGSLTVMLSKPVKRKTMVIFAATAIVFTGNIAQSLTLSPVIWCAAAFISYMTAAVMNANLTTVMRHQIPIEMQGRVFSVKDTLQNCFIPLGLFLGGLLADNVMEPFMASASPVQAALSRIFAAGSGAGIAVIFFAVGIIGVIMSLAQPRDPVYKELDE